MSSNRNRTLVYRQAPVPGINSAGASDEALGAPADRVRVGLCDCNSSAGALPTLLELMESCQDRFSFRSVEAPFPSGITVPGLGAAEDWLMHTGRPMDPMYASHNVAARPIFLASAPVLKRLPIEWLIVIVKSMIADTTDPEERWYNLFSTSKKNVVIISTYELREYAAQAQRSFEAAVFGVGLSALLAAMIPDIEYQDASTGSIFDFCANRSDIVESFREPRIDPENRARIPTNLLGPVDALLKALKQYKGGAPLRKARGNPPRPLKTRAPAKQSASSVTLGERRSLGFAKTKAKTLPATRVQKTFDAAGTFREALASLNKTLGPVSGKAALRMRGKKK